MGKKLEFSNYENIAVDDNLFSYQDTLYVPLVGGQIFGLDMQDGSQKWLWSDNHAGGGRFESYESEIYCTNYEQLFKIDGNTGQTIKAITFSATPEVTQFRATGPIWVYEDVVICMNVGECEVLILNRSDLSFRDFVKIHSIHIPNGKSSICWQDKKLYVIDGERVLHIFEDEMV